MGAKIGASFMAYIQAKAVKAMASVITSAADHGVSGYIQNGFTDAAWVTLGRNVKLANGGSQVYALGTNIALASVMPAKEANGQFRYGEDGAIVKTGFLPEYKRIPMVELDNALVPNTINGTPIAVVPDDVIYFVAMGSYKPIKIVFEGNNVTVAQDPLTSADHTYGMTVDMRIGVDAVVGSKFGAIKLA